MTATTYIEPSHLLTSNVPTQPSNIFDVAQSFFYRRIYATQLNKENGFFLGEYKDRNASLSDSIKIIKALVQKPFSSKYKLNPKPCGENISRKIFSDIFARKPIGNCTEVKGQVLQKILRLKALS